MFSQKILKIILVFSIIVFSLNTNLAPQGDFYFNPAKDWHDYAKIQQATAPVGSARHEQQCIAEALYYEARGEGEQGMRYVLSVIHNRKNSIGFPNSYCKVIHQRKQFSYRNSVNPGLHVAVSPQKLHDQQSYILASTIAEEAAYGRFKPLLDADVLYYHTPSVNPKWARAMQKIKSIAGHHFLAKRKD